MAKRSEASSERRVLAWQQGKGWSPQSRSGAERGLRKHSVAFEEQSRSSYLRAHASHAHLASQASYSSSEHCRQRQVGRQCTSVAGNFPAPLITSFQQLITPCDSRRTTPEGSRPSTSALGSPLQPVPATTGSDRSDRASDASLWYCCWVRHCQDSGGWAKSKNTDGEDGEKYARQLFVC